MSYQAQRKKRKRRKDADLKLAEGTREKDRGWDQMGRVSSHISAMYLELD